MALFCVLAFAWTWGLLLGVLVIPGTPMEDTGPTVLWALAGLGPGVAAFVAAAVGDGRRGVRALVRGIARWRIGWWYLLLLAPLPIALVAVLVAVWVGPAGVEVAPASHWLLLPAFAVSGILFGGLEEIGWRGYLLPKLQDRWTALATSVAIGLVWALWHAPLFLIEGTTQAATSVGWFTVQAVALSILLTWAYNSTGGSVLLAVLAHGALNTWYTTVVQGLAPAAMEAFTPYAALLVIAAALVVVWRHGARDLSRQPRHGWEAETTPEAVR